MKIKIVNLVCAAVALVLEILPFGIIMDMESFYQESKYYSYFHTDVWNYGDIAPMICGILTSIIFCMAVAVMFFKPHRSYTLSMAILSFAAVVISLIPTLYGTYSVFGLIITLCLSANVELCAMIFVNKLK